MGPIPCTMFQLLGMDDGGCGEDETGHSSSGVTAGTSFLLRYCAAACLMARVFREGVCVHNA